MSRKKLVVLGSVNADHVLQIDSFPRPGETVTGHGYRVIPGGKGANQAVAAARLGGDVSFIACVGDDAFGSRMIREFQQDGMDTSAVMTIPNTPTGIALIQVAENGENSIAIAPEANACLTPEALAPHLPRIREADILLMQLETPLETVELAAQEARAHGTMVILNPAPARELPETIINNVNLLSPNETEAEFYTDVAVGSYADACRAAEIMHARKLEGLLITMGKSGAYYSGPHGARLVDAFPVEPVDTTAAGDTFNGALAVGLAEDMDMDQAIRFAHAAAAISVTRAGAQTSIPTRSEVDEFLKAKH